MIQKTTNLKHRLVIELLYSTGIRLSELLALKADDISVSNSTMMVRQGKGGKDRLTIISPSWRKEYLSLSSREESLKAETGAIQRKASR